MNTEELLKDQALGEDNDRAIPDWVVTYGDMMSLLLTFFIMLVSLSDIKEEQRYQAMVESVRMQFGYDQSRESVTPGEMPVRPSKATPLGTLGRAQIKDLAKGGVPEKAPYGDQRHVQNQRRGKITAISTVISFPVGSSTLTPIDKKQLSILAEQLRDKQQMIEIRSHVAPRLAERADSHSESIQRSVHLGRQVMDYFTNVEGLEESRFRISSQVDHDSESPFTTRVEVFLLDTLSSIPGQTESSNPVPVSSPRGANSPIQ